MTLTCGDPSDRLTTCPFCLNQACNACPREPEKRGELRICQHRVLERHTAIPALAEDEPLVNRTPTVKMPAMVRDRVRIALDFTSGDVGQIAHALERLAVIARRRGRVVLVEEDDER